MPFDVNLRRLSFGGRLLCTFCGRLPEYYESWAVKFHADWLDSDVTLLAGSSPEPPGYVVGERYDFTVTATSVDDSTPTRPGPIRYTPGMDNE